MADEQATPRKSLRGHVSPANTPTLHVLRTRAARSGDTGSGKKKSATNVTPTATSGASAKKASNIQKDAEGNLIYKRRSSIGTRSSSSGTDKVEPTSKQTPPSRMHGTRLSTGSLKEPTTIKSETVQLRKRSTSHESQNSSETVPTPKKRKIGKPSDSNHDNYCWQCHGDGQCVGCELCPRVYHTKCLGMDRDTVVDWVCPECERIMRAECVDTRSQSLSVITVDQLCLLLKYSLSRMKCSGSDPFQKPVDTSQVTNYSDFVFNPIDLSMLEKNVKKKMYGSTEAFLSDAKWVLHNCIIFNGKHHKLTTVAKTIIKIAKHEMNEIEICPDCYFNSCTKRGDNWFCEPCRVPHPLVWAKMRGYPFWPAKALRTVKDQVDCRFFGEHDRAWVHVSSVFLLSEECPVLAKKKTHGFDLSMEELSLHIKRIKNKFGSFVYAPVRTPFGESQKAFDQRSKEGDRYSVKSERDDEESVQSFQMLEDKDPETGSDIHITGTPRKTPGMGRGGKMTITRRGIRKAAEKTQSIAYRTASALKSKYNRKSIITTRLAKARGNAASSAVAVAKLDQTSSSLVETGSEQSYALDDVQDEEIKEFIGAIFTEDNDEFGQPGIMNKENSKNDVTHGDVISINSDHVVDSVSKKTVKIDDSLKSDTAPENALIVDDSPGKSAATIDYLEKFDLTQKADLFKGDMTQKGELENENKGKVEGFHGPLLQSDRKKNPMLAKIVESCKEKLGISDEEEILEKSEEEELEDGEITDKEVSDVESPDSNAREGRTRKGFDSVHLVTSTTVASTVCVYCGVTFASERAVNVHVSAEHPPVRAHQCIMCRKEFSYRSHAVAHLKQSHKIVTDEFDTFIIKTDVSSKKSARKTVPPKTSENEKDEPVVGGSVTSTQNTSLTGGDSNPGTSLTGGEANPGTSGTLADTSVVSIDSDTDSSVQDSSQSDRLVIDLEKSQDSPQIASKYTSEEPSIVSEIRKKRKLTPPKTGKIVKRKSSTGGGGGIGGLYVAESPGSKGEMYKINTGKETLKLSVGQLRMLEAAGKLKNPSWRESQKSAGDKVTPVRPTQSTAEVTRGDDQIVVGGMDPTQNPPVRDRRSEMIDSQREEPIDPVQYSSDSDEEVKNYKLNMENSVERPKETEETEEGESQASKPTSETSITKRMATLKKTDTSASSDKENTAADESVTEISWEDVVDKTTKGQLPRQQQQLKKPIGVSIEVRAPVISEESGTGLVIREVGTLRQILPPEDVQDSKVTDKEESKNGEGVGNKSGTAVEDVAIVGTTEGECVMAVTVPDCERLCEKTGQVVVAVENEKSLESVQDMGKTSSISPDSTETQKAFPVVSTGGHRTVSMPESSTSEGITKDPTDQTLGDVDKEPELLSGVELPTFDPVDAADSVFDLNKYTAQMMNSVKDVMTTMAKDLLAKQAGEALKSSFKLEIEKLKWKQEQELLEIKHNSAVTIAEVKSAFDKVMKKAMTDQHNKLTNEKEAAVKETKKKQWCANCGEEAVFYCCWNTSYCDFPCQKQHWPQHMNSCTQTSTTRSAHGAQPATGSDPNTGASGQGSSASTSSWKEQARENLAQVLNKQIVPSLYSDSTVAPPSQLITNQAFTLPTSVVSSTQFLTQPRPTLVQQLGGGIRQLGPAGYSVSHPSQPPPRDNNPPPPIIMMQNRPPPGGVDMIAAPIYQPRTL